MESADVDLSRGGCEHALEPCAKRRGRGGRKRNGKDARRRDRAVEDQMGDTTCTGRRLAAAWPGDNAEWSLTRRDRVSLLGAEARQIHDLAGRSASVGIVRRLVDAASDRGARQLIPAEPE